MYERLSFYLLIFLLFSAASAAEFRSGDEVVVTAGEVVAGDLYVGANEITIEGTVEGDVIAAGRTVTVLGTVEGDLLAAGQTVSIEGTVADDARLTGAALRLGAGAQVGGDLVGSAYALETEPGSRIGGDLVFGGRQALLAGELTGDALTGSQGLELRGAVGGNVNAAVGAAEGSGFQPPAFGLPPVADVAPGLTLADTARIEGDLQLDSSSDLDVNSEVVAGEVSTDISQDTPTQGSPLRGFINRYLVLVLAGLLLLWLAPALLERAATYLEAKPLANLGWGALTLFGVPAAVALLIGLAVLLAVLFGLVSLGGVAGFIGFVGIAAALITGLLFVLAALFGAQVVVGYAGGRWLLARFGSDSSLLALLLGLLVLAVLAVLPFVGALVALAAVVIGLGALVLAGRGRGAVEV